MREYELKRGVAKALEGDGLRMIAAETFAGAGTDGNRIVVSFGAIERMVAWTDGKKLYVDTTMKSGAPDHVARIRSRLSTLSSRRRPDSRPRSGGRGRKLPRRKATHEDSLSLTLDVAGKEAGAIRFNRRARRAPQPPLPRRLSLLPSFPLSSSLPSSRRRALPRARRRASRRRPSGPRRCSRLPAPRSGPSRGPRRPSRRPP